MRVAIDVTNFVFGLTNGTPIFLHNLVRALTEADQELELVLLYAHRINPVAREVLEGLRGPRVEVARTSFLRHGLPAGAWWYPFQPTVERIVGRVDLFHAGDFVRPEPGGIPTVISVLDLTTKLYPLYHTRANILRDGWKLRWACDVADRIVTISEATKRDLVRLMGVDPDRVDTVPLARGQKIEPVPEERVRAVRERYGLGTAPFILSVGTLEPRKNHRGLVAAFESLQDGHPDTRLVLAGGRGWKVDEIERCIAASPARDRIHVLGLVPSDELHALYAGATVFAYPSLYEGFGLPVLEAMAAGLPVITSTASSLPEVAGDAALLVDPQSVDSIRGALVRLLGDSGLRLRLSEKGREQERQFTWRRTAELTLESYRRAAETRRSEART